MVLDVTHGFNYLCTARRYKSKT
ncbi:CRISPR-associated DxTHG motif protein [Psychrobacter sanguinis]|uniref:CRISPR-associated DxTHG motif protein n=1 Tax=Psychrobacter sanguinis TaxID=861445 RepID=A0A844LYS2_9GAMM|nr:CRISPR-associated DxTHG motif protein [Psychrobacter sanguinis]